MTSYDTLISYVKANDWIAIKNFDHTSIHPKPDQPTAFDVAIQFNNAKVARVLKQLRPGEYTDKAFSWGAASGKTEIFQVLITLDKERYLKAIEARLSMIQFFNKRVPEYAKLRKFPAEEAFLKNILAWNQ